jgi:hypothetical protein
MINISKFQDQFIWIYKYIIKTYINIPFSINNNEIKGQILN